MKRLLFVFILSFSLLKLSAQDSVIHLPDSVGKYLFEYFINKGDISQSEVVLAETDFFNPKDMWPILLDKVSELNFNAQNTKYYNTYFQQRRHRGTLYVAELYVSMKKENDIYAFKAGVLWDGSDWQIAKIDTDIFKYSQAEDMEYGFQNITNDEVVVIDSDYEYSNFKSLVSIAPKTLHTPDSFSKKTLELLSDESPFGNDEIFLTKQEYMDTEGKRILNLIDKLLESGADIESEKEKIMFIRNNPDILYEELVYPWGMLPGSLKKEFGDNIKGLEIKDIELEISNWNEEKGQIDNSTISATISMSLHYNGKDAGIYFSAIQYNGMWKLSHIQGFAYGISSAENVSSEYMEDEITIGVVDELQ